MEGSRIKYTKEKLEEAVKACTNYNDVARMLGCKPEGSRVAHIKSRIEKLGLDTSHFTGKKLFAKGRVNYEIPLEEFLVKDFYGDGRRTGGYRLRRALVKLGREEICSECPVGIMWNDKPLVLEVDHINGDPSDNRPENLRFMCPNCHSQTETSRRRK